MATKEPDDPKLRPVMAALADWNKARDLEKAKRKAFSQAVAKAIRDDDIKPGVIVAKTKKSAETIRQMARENGVEPLRPPTVTSLRNLEKARERLAEAGLDVEGD